MKILKHTLEYNAGYENKYKFRFYNWKDFIEEELENESYKLKNIKYLVIILHYNNNKIYKLLEKIINDSYYHKEFSVLIVDNHSENKSYRKLREFCKNYNVSLIRTKVNLGGAGGYSIGIEYFLKDKRYSHLIIMEDDVNLLQNNSLKDLIDESKKNPKAVIYTHYFEKDCPSFTLHFSLYPREIIEKVGCLNVFYFMRSDDYEYGFRINKIIQKYKLPKIYLDRIKYSHPVLKAYKYSTFTDYLAKRNTLLFLSRYKDYRYFKNFILSLLVSTFNAVFYLLKEKSLDLIKPILYSIIDTFKTISLELNMRRLKNNKVLTVSEKYEIRQIDDLIKKNKYKTLSPVLHKFLKFPFGFSRNNFATTNFYYPFYFLSSLAKESIYVVDINVVKNYAVVYENTKNNKEIIRNFLIFILSLVLFIFIFVPILFVIFLKIFTGLLKNQR